MTEIDRFSAVVSKRCKLIAEDAKNEGLGFDTLMTKALTRDSDLTQEQLASLRERIQEAVEESESKIILARRNGRVQMADTISGMTAEQKMNEIKEAFAKLKQMSEAHHFSQLMLTPEMIALLERVTAQPIHAQEVELTNEQMTDALMACYEQLALYAVSERLVEDGEAGISSGIVLYETDMEAERERRELAVAAAVSLSMAGELPEELSKLELQSLSDYVCFGMEIGSICDKAATGHMDFATFLDAAGNLLLGFASLTLSAAMLLSGSGFGFLLFMAGAAVAFYAGFSVLYEALLPAGIAETRLGAAVHDVTDASADFVIRLVTMVVHQITDTVKSVYHGVKNAIEKMDEACKEAAEAEEVNETDEDQTEAEDSEDDPAPQMT